MNVGSGNEVEDIAAEARPLCEKWLESLWGRTIVGDIKITKLRKGK